MRRSTSLKRGRIEGNDTTYNNTGSSLSPSIEHDSKRVRRTISDERKDVRSVSFEGATLERSISVGTFERGMALGRKRRNSNFAIPAVLAPWLPHRQSSSSSSESSIGVLEGKDVDANGSNATSISSKPQLKVTNTRVRSVSSFDLGKDGELFSTEKERSSRDRVVSFGLVTAAEALGDSNFMKKKTVPKSSIVNIPPTIQRSYSAPATDHSAEQNNNQNKDHKGKKSGIKNDKNKGGDDTSMLNQYSQQDSGSMFSMEPSEALFNQVQPPSVFSTDHNNKITSSSSVTTSSSHLNDKDNNISSNDDGDGGNSSNNEVFNNGDVEKQSYYAKAAASNIDKNTIYSRQNNSNNIAPNEEEMLQRGKEDRDDAEPNKEESNINNNNNNNNNNERKNNNEKVETAEEKNKRLQSSPSFDADIDMLGYDQFHDWHVSDRYKCQKIIGKGSYGSVCQAVDLFGEGNPPVAIKRIDNLFDNMADAKRILREIRILRELRHQNIIPIMDIIKPRHLSTYNELYVVFALRDTDLLKLIQDHSQVLSIEHVKFFMAQLLRGVQYMHNSHVIHRDLKPANILLTENCELSICDFGLARGIDTDNDNNNRRNGMPTLVNNNNAHESKNQSLMRSPPKYRRQMTQHVATRWYRAPELILKCSYNGSIDVWSAGCIFAEMLTMMTSGQSRDPLFPGGPCALSPTSNNMPRHERLSQLDMIFDVIGTPSRATIDAMTGGHADNRLIREDLLQRNPIKPQLSLAQRFPKATAEAIDLLEKLLKFDPSERIDINDAISHPFVTSFSQSYTEELQKGKQADFTFESIANDVASIRAFITEEIIWYEKTWSEEEQKQKMAEEDGF